MEVYDIHFIYFGEVLPVFIDEIDSQCIGKWKMLKCRNWSSKYRTDHVHLIRSHWFKSWS